jgi:NAD-dependent SIR2 family protein deacetylase
MLPLEAKRTGAKLVLVNLSATPYDDYMDEILFGTAGPILQALMEELKK